jgi:hypothetical protein
LIFDTLLWAGGALSLKKNCGGGSLLISYKKYIKDGKVLAHFGLKLKVLSGSLTDLRA